MEAEKLPADRVTSSVIASLLHQAYDLGLTDLVATCKSSLAAQTGEAALTILSQHEVYISTNRSAAEAASKWQLLTSTDGTQSNLYTNFKMRFSLNTADKIEAASSAAGEEPKAVAADAAAAAATRRPRRASLLQRMTDLFSGEGDELQPGDYEEVTSAVILSAPISDICVIQKNEAPPLGYYRISKTPTGKKANVNTGSGGTQMYLCIKKDNASQEQAPITSILLVFADRGEFLPPFYSLVRRNKFPCNFNLGTSGERVYLAYKRERHGNPVTDIQVILPGSAEITPPGFSLLDKSPTGAPANLNNGTGGSRVYLCYKQSVKTLQVLKFRDSAASASSRRRADSERDPAEGGGTGHARESPSRARATTAYLRDVLSPSSSFVNNRMRTSTMDSVNSALSDDALPSAESSLQAPDVLAAAASGNIRDEEEDEEEEDAEEDEDEDIDSEGYGNRTSRALVDDLAFDVEDQPTKGITDARGTPQTAAMCEAIFAILTGLRVRFPTLAQTSIQGLMLLLKETDMFIADLHSPNGRSLTLLHVCVNAVCERIELCIESEMRSLLFFLFSVVKVSKGTVHPANLQRIFKAYAFVLQCQAARVDLSSPEGALQQQPSSAQPISMSSLFNEMPLDMTPLTALKDIMRTVFKPVEMLSETCSDLSSHLHFLPREDRPGESFSLPDPVKRSESYTVAHEIVLELLDSVLDAVEMARITEIALKVISRSGLTVANNTYWSQVYVISHNLFVEPHLRSCYMILCSVLKMSWNSVRLNDRGVAMARDLNLKLMGLQAVCDYLSVAGELQKSSELMGFQVRRLVVPCILANVPFALKDHRIFTKLMWIISLLWKNWRAHTHLEFAILVEQLIVPVMQAAAPRQIQPIFQMVVIQEVVSWFDQPALLVEMFVNFDMDRSSMSHWNVFSHLVRTICVTARKISTDKDADNIEGGSEVGKNTAGYVDAIAMSVTPRGVHIQALEEACRIAKALMDAAGHAYLIVKDADFRTRSVAVGAGWEENENDDEYSLEDSDHERSDDESSAKQARSRSGKKGGVRFKRALYAEKEEILKEAIALYHAKDKNLIKAVRYLVNKHFMEDTPQDIAQFLRLHRSHFDPRAIGDFLGEGGDSPQEIEYWAQIRFRYSRAISFVDMDVESALRLYLTGSGFRLPGEAQKVDRFVEVFVKVFWQDNSGTERCPFRHPDTVHLLTYAIIMLNTDHHRANVEKKHANRKMTQEQFIKNLRGADMGHDIDANFLRNVFDAVHLNAIELEFDDDVTAAKRPATRSSVLGSIGFSFAPPSGAKSPTGLDEAEDANGGHHHTKFCKAIEKTLRDSRDLMRSLSSYVYHFSICGVDTNISLDLVSFMYETVWSHFRVVASALLVQPNQGLNQDMFVTFHALDLLCYSLTSAIFLDMKSQKMVLADQLLKFETTYCSNLDNSWYTDVCECSQDDCMEVISHLHKDMVRIKDSCQQKANKEQTIAAAKRIEKSANVLDHNAYFVREGDVEKRNRKGGTSRYRLFLFSDQLIYTKVGGIFHGEYKVRGQLSLRTMCVSDIDTDPSQRSLYIEHPYKNFVIVCDTPLLKTQWLRDIHQTINNSNRRASMAEAEAEAEGLRAAAEKNAASGSAQKIKAMSPNPALISPKVTKPASEGRKAALSVDLAEDQVTVTVTRKSPRRMSGGRMPTCPIPEMNPRMEAAIASQAALLRTALNSSAERPLRLSLTREDVNDIKKINFATIKDESFDGNTEANDSPNSSAPTSPASRAENSFSKDAFSAECYNVDSTSEHSNLSSDTDSGHEEELFARIKAATDHQRESRDLSADADYQDL